MWGKRTKGLKKFNRKNWAEIEFAKKSLSVIIK